MRLKHHLTPVVVRVKLDMSTSITAAEKVTVKATLSALVGLVSARVTAVTVRKALLDFNVVV